MISFSNFQVVQPVSPVQPIQPSQASQPGHCQPGQSGQQQSAFVQLAHPSTFRAIFAASETFPLFVDISLVLY